VILWSSPGALEMVRQSNPDLAKKVDGMTHVLKVHNLLVEAESLGLTVDARCVDIETAGLVSVMRTELAKRKPKK